MGLDKIKAQIQKDAEDTANTILSDAQAQALALKNTMGSQAKAEAEDILVQAGAKAQDRIDRARAAAAQEGKRRLLLQRRQLMDEVFTQTLEALKRLPEAEYFALLHKRILEHAMEAPGMLLLSQEDKNRIPAGWLDELNQEIKGPLQLSGETIGPEGGFVLQYGGIEINETFAAIIHSERQRLEDAAAVTLFGPSAEGQ